MPYHHLSWDNVIALGYAAEQLCLAAQILTSDTIPQEYGVQKSCEHLQRLIEHRDLLPSNLITSIEACLHTGRDLAQSSRVVRERPTGKNGESTRQLSGTILQVLDDVRRVLNAEAKESADERRAA